MYRLEFHLTACMSFRHCSYRLWEALPLAQYFCYAREWITTPVVGGGRSLYILSQSAVYHLSAESQSTIFNLLRPRLTSHDSGLDTAGKSYWKIVCSKAERTVCAVVAGQKLLMFRAMQQDLSGKMICRAMLPDP
jgi:hypothetical protein